MVYIALAKNKFLNQCAYKVDCLFGIINIVMQILIFWSIYKVLYAGSESVQGISFSMLTTNFVLMFGLNRAFCFNDQFVNRKVRDGSIANELLRPISFLGRMFAESLGDVMYSLVFQFFPVLVVATLVVGIEPPKNPAAFFLFIISVIIGFLILWSLSTLVQMSSFWIVNVWSLSTIKNVVVNVLSGALFPLWFFPEKLKFLIDYTPFSLVYFEPAKIYFGQTQIAQCPFVFVKQLIWLVVLFVLSKCMWESGKKKIVLQGG